VTGQDWALANHVDSGGKASKAPMGWKKGKRARGIRRKRGTSHGWCKITVVRTGSRDKRRPVERGFEESQGN